MVEGRVRNCPRAKAQRTQRGSLATEPSRLCAFARASESELLLDLAEGVEEEQRDYHDGDDAADEKPAVGLIALLRKRFACRIKTARGTSCLKFIEADAALHHHRLLEFF